MGTSEDSIKNCPTNQQTKQMKKKQTQPNLNKTKQTTVPISEPNNHNCTTDHLLSFAHLLRPSKTSRIFDGLWISFSRQRVTGWSPRKGRCGPGWFSFSISFWLSIQKQSAGRLTKKHHVRISKDRCWDLFWGLFCGKVWRICAGTVCVCGHWGTPNLR